MALRKSMSTRGRKDDPRLDGRSSTYRASHGGWVPDQDKHQQQDAPAKDRKGWWK